MDMEKNICDSVIGMLLNIQGKRKDGLNTCQDLHHPKTSIFERYIAEETIEFCLEYIEKAKLVGVPQSRHDKKVGGMGSRGLHVITSSLEELQQSHLYILNNINEVLPYIVCDKALVKESNPNMTKNKVLKEHNKTFLNWFKDIIFVAIMLLKR